MQTPVGTATTTTQTMNHPMGTMTRERTTVRTRTTHTRHHGMAVGKRHCKTWWKQGRKMRSCKAMARHK